MKKPFDPFPDGIEIEAVGAFSLLPANNFSQNVLNAFAHSSYD